MKILEVIQRESGIEYKQKTKKEWAGPCPFCGGEDRFYIQPFRNQKGGFRCRQCEKAGDIYDFLKYFKGLDFAAAKKYLGVNTPTRAKTPPPPLNHIKHGKPTMVWKYRDKTGSVLGYVCRYDPENQKKQFCPVWLKNGQWRKTAPAKPWPLYGLERLRKKLPVVLVESEKAADFGNRLAGENFVFLSWYGSASSVDIVDFSPLSGGRQVFLWPDNDEVGKLAMKKIAKTIKKTGGSVSGIVRPSKKWPAKADLADFPTWTGKNVINVIQTRTEKARAVRLKSVKSFENFEFPEIKWVLPGIIPEGVSLFAGKPKMGKSVFCQNLCLSVATGANIMGITAPRGSAIYLSIDDVSERRFIFRLREMCGIEMPLPENFQFATQIPKMGSGGLQAIREIHSDFPDCRVIVVDTLQRFRPEDAKKRGNSTLYMEDYDMLAALNDLAIELGLSIICVAHTRKADADDVFDMISGSLGLQAAVDTILMLTRTAEGEPVLHVRGRDVEENSYFLEQNRPRKIWKITKALQEEDSLPSSLNKVLKIIEKNPDIGPKSIALQAGIPERSVKFAIKGLLDKFLILKTGRGAYRARKSEKCVSCGNMRHEYNYCDRYELARAKAWEKCQGLEYKKITV